MKRRWILWLLLIVFVWLVVAQFTEIEQLVETLSQGQWQWILFAVLLQFLYYVIYTALYQSAFATVDVESRLRNLLPIIFAAIYVNVVAPSGGASGAALFVDDAARRPARLRGRCWCSLSILARLPWSLSLAWPTSSPTTISKLTK